MIQGAVLVKINFLSWYLEQFCFEYAPEVRRSGTAPRRRTSRLVPAAQPPGRGRAEPSLTGMTGREAPGGGEKPASRKEA